MKMIFAVVFRMREGKSELFHQWFCPISTPKGKTIWRLYFLACIWTIWKERNRRCFERINTSQEDLILKMKFCVASWVSHLPDFWGLPLAFEGSLSSLYFSPPLGGGCIFGACPSRFLYRSFIL